MIESSVEANAARANARYLLETLRHPGVLRILTSCMVARIPNAMAPLAIVLTVRHLAYSYAFAGAAAATYSICLALGAPLMGRAMDSRGAGAVLPAVSIFYATAMVVAAIVALAHWPVVLFFAAVGLAGATNPPVAPALRAAWSSVLAEGRRVEDAFRLEAIVQEVMFAGSPLLAASIAATGHPAAALAVGGGLAWSATLLFVRVMPPRPAATIGERAIGRLGALASTAVSTIVVATFFIGWGFGSLEVGMPAFFEQIGRARALAGFPLTAFATGSIVGGVLVAGRGFRRPAESRVAVGWVCMGIGVALLLLSNSLWSVTLISFVAGLPSAPMLALTYQLVEKWARQGTTNEAFTWLATALLGGVAFGTAVGGLLIGAGGARLAWIAAATALVASGGVSAAGFRRVQIKSAAA